MLLTVDGGSRRIRDEEERERERMERRRLQEEKAEEKEKVRAGEAIKVCTYVQSINSVCSEKTVLQPTCIEAQLALLPLGRLVVPTQ